MWSIRKEVQNLVGGAVNIHRLVRNCAMLMDPVIIAVGATAITSLEQDYEVTAFQVLYCLPQNVVQ